MLTARRQQSLDLRREGGVQAVHQGDGPRRAPRGELPGGREGILPRLREAGTGSQSGGAAEGAARGRGRTGKGAGAAELRLRVSDPSLPVATG